MRPASEGRVVRAVGLAAALVWAPAIGLGGAQEGGSGTEPAAASPVTVEATAGKAEVTVGETFELTVKASGPAGTEYMFPAGASEDAFELSTPGAGEERGDATSPPPAAGTHRYEAAVYTLGTATLPPVPVRYRLPDGTEGQVETEPVTVEVVSMLPKDPEQQKLADIHPPRAATLGQQYWHAVRQVVLIAMLVLLVLFGGVAGTIAWLRRRRGPEVGLFSRLGVPPDGEALRALDELAASGLLEAGAFRSFYIRLTMVAKRYLERRLEAPVLEMTTAETVAFLRGHEHGGDVLPVMRDLAVAADRIKFARGEGLAAEAERHLAAMRALVPALEARLRPPEPETPEEGKAA